MSLRLKNYTKFDKGVEASAIIQAKKLIDDYEAFLGEQDDASPPAMRLIYTTDQSKVVEEYTLLKVWHILHGSGFFLDYKIFQLKDRVRVVLNIEVSEIDDSDDDSDDSDDSNDEEDPIAMD